MAPSVSGRPHDGGGALLIAHASVFASDRLRGDGAFSDVLLYGAGVETSTSSWDGAVHTVPSGRPVGRLVRALILFVRLRRRRWALVTLLDKETRYSRVRGPLLLAAALLGPTVVASSDHPDRRIPVPFRTACLDAARWLAIQPVAVVGALALGVAARVLERGAAPNGVLPADAIAGGNGDVAYLRTDLDPKDRPLAAGGSLAHTRGIVEALQRRGLRVQVLTTLELTNLPARTQARRLPVVRRANVPLELLELLSGLRQGLARHRDMRVDTFVYQRYSLNNLAGVILARRWRVPLVLEVNASEVKWRRQWSTLRFGSLAAACERLLLQHATRVVAVSENVASDVRALGVDPSRIRVVPNGVEVERFANAPSDRGPFDEGAFVVAFAGLFYPWHGVPRLAEAFARLHSQRPEARLVLLGDGADAPATRRVLAERGVERFAYMPGLVPVDQVPGLLKGADVLASPHARVEGFIGSPVKVFEYMATGRAIVASRLAQIGTVLRHGETALLVEPGDVDDLAAALERLHDDPDLRTRLGQAAQEDARRNHSWDSRLDSILAT